MVVIPSSTVESYELPKSYDAVYNVRLSKESLGYQCPNLSKENEERIRKDIDLLYTGFEQDDFFISRNAGVKVADTFKNARSKDIRLFGLVETFRKWRDSENITILRRNPDADLTLPEWYMWVQDKIGNDRWRFKNGLKLEVTSKLIKKYANISKSPMLSDSSQFVIRSNVAFVTFTVNPVHFPNEYEAALYIKKNKNRILQRLRNSVKSGVRVKSYLCVMESQKNGFLHLHCIFFLDKQYLLTPMISRKTGKVIYRFPECVRERFNDVWTGRTGGMYHVIRNGTKRLYGASRFKIGHVDTVGIVNQDFIVSYLMKDVKKSMASRLRKRVPWQSILIHMWLWLLGMKWFSYSKDIGRDIEADFDKSMNDHLNQRKYIAVMKRKTTEQILSLNYEAECFRLVSNGSLSHVRYQDELENVLTVLAQGSIKTIRRLSSDLITAIINDSIDTEKINTLTGRQFGEELIRKGDYSFYADIPLKFFNENSHYELNELSKVFHTRGNDPPNWLSDIILMHQGEHSMSR